MAAWVKCTDVQERTIFLNLDNAISIVEIERTGLTKVAFIGSTKPGKGIAARVGFAEVAETPID